jgi:SpoVK/Ycf46/Vps4 family AAA+-type ATPase
MKTSDYKSFAYLENGDINFTQYETIKSTSILDSGSYKLNYEGYPKNQIVLKTDSDFETTKTHNFSDKQKIDNLFCSFFDKSVASKIEGLGFCHKTGVLLHGIEGTGKSTIIKYYCNKAIIEHSALVFHILCKDDNFFNCWEFIQGVRRIQNNSIIIVFDEFDQQMERNESYLKTVIDGNMSISSCMFFAATNYLDKIPKAMKDRPSRFKYCLNIEGMQVKSDIETIIKPILNELLSSEEISQLAIELKGKTLDYIKQFCFDKLMGMKHFSNSRPVLGFTKV